MSTRTEYEKSIVMEAFYTTIKTLSYVEQLSTDSEEYELLCEAIRIVERFRMCEEAGI